MMILNDVNKLADLARLDIPESEKETMLTDLTSILAYVDQIRGISSDTMKPELSSIRNVSRLDTAANPTGSNADDLIKEMPESLDRFLKVKPIL